MYHFISMNYKKIIFVASVAIVLLAGTAFQLTQKQSFKLVSTSGSVDFKSDAPLEMIEASSQNLKGVIDPANNRFAFSIPIKSFQGFNSPLQREHFNENYMESDKYPTATFEGKIIENIDYSANGLHIIRAKGALTIHGVTQERIIRSELEVKDGDFHVTSQFTVLLKEHDISIPKIVNQKIAEEIFVEVKAVFAKK